MAGTIAEKLALFGQSIWLDNINRTLIESGKLQEMIDQGLRGMTSNPTIFDKAISRGEGYDERIRELCSRGRTPFEIYDDLTVRDIQDAADIFRPVYDRTGGIDGFVSLEINPQLAFNATETIEEGMRLFEKVNRPNVMFKVPSTDAGFEPVEEFLARGMNINVTLIFSLSQYEKTAQAFLKGMRRLADNNGDLGKVNSVASVFVSRIDTTVDRMLEERVDREADPAVQATLRSLIGKAAVANSAIIYHRFLQIFSGKEFQDLKAKGAHIQRVLWGSTSTKNPAYSDLKYVTELIGKDTVNTMPDNTFEAFMDHGRVEDALTSYISEARSVVDSLKDFGIDVNAVCKQLLDDGVAAFEKSFVSLLNSIEKKIKSLCAT